MIEDADQKPPVHVEIPFSESGSAHAPILYFEGASTFGHMNGIIRVTLEAVRLYSATDGQVSTDRVVVGRLRMNIPAAMSLKHAIESALLLAAPASSEAKN